MKLDRKSLKKPDKFLSFLHHFITFFHQHIKIIGISFISLVIFTALLVLTNYYKKHKEEKAQTLLARAQNYHLSFKKEGKGELAQEDSQYLEKLIQLTQKYPRTQATLTAYFELGQIYYENGDLEKSISWWEKAAKKADKKLIRVLAWQNVAYAYERAKKYKEALEKFKEAQKILKKDSVLNADLLFSIARCYENLNQKALAQKSYYEIIDNWPESNFSEKARGYLSLIK